jgi:hypothetical protein
MYEKDSYLVADPINRYTLGDGTTWSSPIVGHYAMTPSRCERSAGSTEIGSKEPNAPRT